MGKENVVQKKSYDFALKIVRLYKNLVDTRKEYIIGKQILRSGTSIGANIEEGIGGQSRRDFLAKISISYKEARETKYWLNLLYDGEYIKANCYNELKQDCEELLRIIGAIKKNLMDNS